jgi:hypothetical protein
MNLKERLKRQTYYQMKFLIDKLKEIHKNKEVIEQVSSST